MNWLVYLTIAAAGFGAGEIRDMIRALGNSLDTFGEALLNLLDPAIDDQAEPAAAPQDDTEDFVVNQEVS